MGVATGKITNNHSSKLISQHEAELTNSCSGFLLFEDARLEGDGHDGGVVRAGQVVGVARSALLLLARGVGRNEARVLLQRQHAALVRDRLHVVLVRVRRLEQAALGKDKSMKSSSYIVHTARRLHAVSSQERENSISKFVRFRLYSFLLQKGTVKPQIPI